MSGTLRLAGPWTLRTLDAVRVRNPGSIGQIVMASIFIVAGLYFAEVGRVMWSDSHNPRVVAQIDHRRCWTSQGSDSSENLCDLLVTYRADDHVVTTKMKAVDEGGIVGNQIKISYAPANVSDASGPENDSATALGMWVFAVLMIALGGWLLMKSFPRQLPS
jgi:hypothetical protein